jgi:GT2 family glycosyltransferase
MHDAHPALSVIIVSYNTRLVTLDCLRALSADLGTGAAPNGLSISAEVFVVDNASTDGSVDAIRERFPDVHVIVNDQNLGFGAANNRTMRLARGEFFLLLNSDAFVQPGAVATLVQKLRSSPRVGVVGPRLLNRDGSLQVSCYRFPSPFRAWVENLWISAAFPHHPIVGDYRCWPHDVPREVDWVIGACMLARREVVEQVGGFDEHFFMYAEESDWQRRIRDAGWKVAFTPDAEVTHLGGASGTTGKPAINRHFFESLDYYERKHHGLLGLLSLRAAMSVGCFLRFWLWISTAIIPRYRAIARGKIRLHALLLMRQLTCWHSVPGMRRTT